MGMFSILDKSNPPKKGLAGNNISVREALTGSKMVALLFLRRHWVPNPALRWAWIFLGGPNNFGSASDIITGAGSNLMIKFGPWGLSPASSAAITSTGVGPGSWHQSGDYLGPFSVAIRDFKPSLDPGTQINLFMGPGFDLGPMAIGNCGGRPKGQVYPPSVVARASRACLQLLGCSTVGGPDTPAQANVSRPWCITPKGSTLCKMCLPQTASVSFSSPIIVPTGKRKA
ncbi:hypothetical protein DSO57_1015830 [Entomophthora muscae]|uniref:Uncharacterized protein n=1 Tax=Entomophthora muscae TaxID=34485 RepID=A0ACC2TGA6_9FUNG|nr:hypothetical protein DSO57_1015830 [Entomophthora muscae]